MSFSIRLTENERKIAESYAEVHSISLGEAFKQALFEKIEDEFDLIAYENAHKDYIKSGKKSRPISELWKELNL